MTLICFVYLSAQLLNTLIVYQFKLQGSPLSLLTGIMALLLCFTLIMSGFLSLLGRKPWEWAVLGWQRSLHGMRFAVLVFICVCPLVWLAGLITNALLKGHEESNPLIPLLQNTRNIYLDIAILLIVMLVAPIVEETLFRGLLLRALGARLPFWSAAALSGCSSRWCMASFPPYCRLRCWASLSRIFLDERKICWHPQPHMRCKMGM